MPQRFLRPGITNSERWNAVSWKAQSLYTRLLTRVDDYGRHDGRVSVVWSNCFAVWNDLNPEQIVELQQVAQMLQELINEDLIEIYESEEKKVLQITQWQERIRSGVKKWWPDKPDSQQVPVKLQQDSRELLRSPSPPSSPSPPTPAISAPAPAEIPDFEQAFAETANAAIPKNFAKYVYDDWASRSGRDGGGNLIRWLPYVSKRWARESVEWRAGTHKGNKQQKKAAGNF